MKGTKCYIKMIIMVSKKSFCFGKCQLLAQFGLKNDLSSCLRSWSNAFFFFIFAVTKGERSRLKLCCYFFKKKFGAFGTSLGAKMMCPYTSGSTLINCSIFFSLMSFSGIWKVELSWNLMVIALAFFCFWLLNFDISILFGSI